MVVQLHVQYTVAAAAAARKETLRSVGWRRARPSRCVCISTGRISQGVPRRKKLADRQALAGRRKKINKQQHIPGAWLVPTTASTTVGTRLGLGLLCTDANKRLSDRKRASSKQYEALLVH